MLLNLAVAAGRGASALYNANQQAKREAAAKAAAQARAAEEALVAARALVVEYPGRGSFAEFEAAVQLVKTADEAEEARRRAEAETEEAKRQAAAMLEEQGVLAAEVEATRVREELERKLRDAHRVATAGSGDAVALKYATAVCSHYGIALDQPIEPQLPQLVNVVPSSGR